MDLFNTLNFKTTSPAYEFKRALADYVNNNIFYNRNFSNLRSESLERLRLSNAIKERIRLSISKLKIEERGAALDDLVDNIVMETVLERLGGPGLLYAIEKMRREFIKLTFRKRNFFKTQRIPFHLRFIPSPFRKSFFKPATGAERTLNRDLIGTLSEKHKKGYFLPFQLQFLPRPFKKNFFKPTLTTKSYIPFHLRFMPSPFRKKLLFKPAGGFNYSLNRGKVAAQTKKTEPS